MTNLPQQPYSIRQLRAAAQELALAAEGNEYPGVSERDALFGLLAAMYSLNLLTEAQVRHARHVWERGESLTQARRRRETRERHEAWLLTATPDEIRLRQSLANCADETREFLEWSLLNQAFSPTLSFGE
jgi:hypothetical protein